MISTCLCVCIHIVAVVRSPSHVQLFVTSWSAAHQASLFLTISWSLPKLMFVASVVPFSHLILWCSLLLLPSIFPSIRGFSNESVLPIRWPKYWSFHFSISPSNEYSGLISLETDWLDLLVLQRTDSQESSPAPQSESINKHQFSSVQLLSCAWLFVIPWTAACQPSLSIMNSQSLLKLMSIKSVMPSNHLILCRPLLLPPSIFPSIRVFWVSSLHQVANVLELYLQHQFFQWIFRTDFLYDGLVGSPCSPRDSQESSPTLHTYIYIYIYINTHI